jgi:hypothetical protein
MSWLPEDFVHPVRVPVPGGYHLRPIKAADTDLDYPAVMGSRERLWSVFGAAWGWPAATTWEQDRADLVRHEAETAWPFTHPRYIGRDLPWTDWLALPDA